MEHITLSNGTKIPKIGYGVFQIGKDDCARCVREAIEIGYRHIDTAQSYFNESEVGEGIKASGISRRDLLSPPKYGLTTTVMKTRSNLLMLH